MEPRIAHEEAGYGQVAALREEAHPELRVLCVAPTGSVAFAIGIGFSGAVGLAWRRRARHRPEP